MQSHRPGWGDSSPEVEPPTPRVRLDDHERTRLSQAASALDDARRADLAQLPEAHLIRMVEQLRGFLDDMVQLLRDLQG